MARRLFTPEEIEQLRANPYTAAVTEERLTFTEDFKIAFRDADGAGIKPTENVRQLGYDPKVLGQQRISMLAYRIRHQAEAAQDSGNDKGADIPRTNRSVKKGGDDQKALEARVEYLESQIDFLKRDYVDRDGKTAVGILIDDATALFRFIAETKANGSEIPIRDMCCMAGVSRSGYYGWLAGQAKREAQEEQDRKDFERILEVYNRRGYSKGVKTIHMGLMHMDPPVQMNVKKIRRIMRKYGLICPLRKPNPYKKMAKAIEESSVAPNILQRDFRSYGPRAVLLTDITYLHYGNGRTAYLSAIEDAFTREILAWVVSESMEVLFVLKTVKQVIDKHGEELADAVLMHSDQGSHYKSCAFRDALKDQSFIQSNVAEGKLLGQPADGVFFLHSQGSCSRGNRKLQHF